MKVGLGRNVMMYLLCDSWRGSCITCLASFQTVYHTALPSVGETCKHEVHTWFLNTLCHCLSVENRHKNTSANCMNRGQTYVPTPLSSYTPMFLQPMFLHPYVPTPLCSDTPMFLHPYTPTNPCEPCSYTLMFLHPYVPTPLCSYTPICRQSVVCPVLGNNFQNFHRNRSWTDD